MEFLNVFVALDIAVLEVLEDGASRFPARLPEWCERFGFRPNQVIPRSDLEERLPYLSTFLLDADQFWGTSRFGVLNSDLWVQRDLDGNEAAMNASAVLTEGQRCLLLSLGTAHLDESYTILQRLRDKALAYERLDNRVSQVQARSREVERLNQLKSEFLASMSHELRTPLNTILGFSDLLLIGRAGQLSSKQHDFLTHVKGAADHLLALINDVLDLSKVEAGHTELSCEYFSVRQALEEVLPGLRSIAIRKGIQLSATSEDRLIYADRVRFKQIVYNLVSNSLKFTGKSGSVDVSMSALEHEVCFTVTDTGIGIPREEQDSIFDKFYQVRGAAGVQEGTGLGLAITKRLVEQHGGRIRVDSEPGHGSRFTFTLAQPEAHTPSAEPSADRRAAAGDTEPAASLSVVLVEDNPSARVLMEAMLAPHHVTCYEDGASALRGIPNLEPDIVLLDISLPDRSGVELLKALRSLGAVEQVPVVALSAHAMSGDREKFLEAGFDAYFSKPIADAATFQRAIEKLAASSMKR